MGGCARGGLYSRAFRVRGWGGFAGWWAGALRAREKLGVALVAENIQRLGEMVVGVVVVSNLSLAKRDLLFAELEPLAKKLGVVLAAGQRGGSEGRSFAVGVQAIKDAAARAGAQAMGLELFAKQPADGLTVITVPSGIDGTAVLGKLERKYGLKLANGQDTLKGKIWRLAHMGYIDQFEVLAALSGLELVLLEVGFGLEPGAGVAAAQRALADAVAVPQTV